MNANEIETAVSEYLENNGVAYTVINVGMRTQKSADREYVQDAWVCTFKRGTQSERFDFFTGIGNRAPATLRARHEATFRFPGLTANDKKGLTTYGRRYLAEVEMGRKPVTPAAASVLHCLLLDSQACGQTFESWCREFDYDADSRKAFDTYQACMHGGEQLQRIFTAQMINDIRELTQDY